MVCNFEVTKLIKYKPIKDCTFKVIMFEGQNKDFMLNYPIRAIWHNYLYIS